MATTEESARLAQTGTGNAHGGREVARALASRGVDKLFTLSGGHLFSIYDGCLAEGIEIVDTRHEQAAAWAAEGYAKATRRAGRRCADGRPRRDERDERDGRRAVQPLAAGGVGRAGAGDALGLGRAPGDRPRAVRRAGDEERRDGEGDGGYRGDDRFGDRQRLDRADRADVRRLSARRRVHGGRGRDPRLGGGAGARGGRDGRGGEDAGRGRAAGDHGRDRRLLGARRGGAGRPRRIAGDPGVPERDGPRLRAGRPRAVLLAGARSRA